MTPGEFCDNSHNFIKKETLRCFPVNFAKFLGTPFLQNTSRRLLLKIAIGLITHAHCKYSLVFLSAFEDGVQSLVQVAQFSHKTHMLYPKIDILDMSSFNCSNSPRSVLRNSVRKGGVSDRQGTFNQTSTSFGILIITVPQVEQTTNAKRDLCP